MGCLCTCTIHPDHSWRYIWSTIYPTCGPIPQTGSWTRKLGLQVGHAGEKLSLSGGSCSWELTYSSERSSRLCKSANGIKSADGVSSSSQGPSRCTSGILAHGFARARCSGCGYDFLVAFSCKGRGACPSCNAKSMDETAAHLVHHVIPYFHFHLCVVDGLFHRVEDDTNQDPAHPETRRGTTP